MWEKLELVRTGVSEEPELYELLDMVEKAITLNGQAHLSTSFHRRVSVMFKLTKDIKAAKCLLKEHESLLKKADCQDLFGEAFYKARREKQQR